MPKGLLQSEHSPFFTRLTCHRLCLETSLISKLYPGNTRKARIINLMLDRTVESCDHLFMATAYTRRPASTTVKCRGCNRVRTFWNKRSDEHADIERCARAWRWAKNHSCRPEWAEKEKSHAAQPAK
jgi:hypothetical protein